MLLGHHYGWRLVNEHGLQMSSTPSGTKCLLIISAPSVKGTIFEHFCDCNPEVVRNIVKMHSQMLHATQMLSFRCVFLYGEL